MLNTLQKIIADSLTNITSIGIADIVDILIVALLFYKIIGLIRRTGSYKAARGVVLLLLALWLSGNLQLYVINFILRSAVQLGLIVVVILFQPELRRIIEKVGSRRFYPFLGSEDRPRNTDAVVTQTIFACVDLARSKTGALLVFERDTLLVDAINSGIQINAELTAELLKNIFFPNAPLHDGAVIVRDGRIAAAGCMLPLSTNQNISKELGTRHRAGIGVSERSDSVAVIVSEETGTISVATDGMLKRYLDPDTFERLLRNELITEGKKKNTFGEWLSGVFR